LTKNIFQTALQTTPKNRWIMKNKNKTNGIKNTNDTLERRLLSEPSSEQITRRAYEIYQERGGESGRDFDDWLQAEREIRARGQASLA
jgi:hypothetical protein